ncbi:MAG: metal-binding protein [Alcanivorax sp.]|nr:MAG: metal-binding protein [Alcanivorax sp.]
MAACGEEATAPAEPPSAGQPAAQVAATDKVLEVYKSPTCGCCGAWVEHMEANGYAVNVHEQQNLQSIKEKAGILPGQGSCHTAFIDGYAIEGHVPAADVDRLLEERPEGKGLTVPGMPVGSPGMEMGDRKDAYDVLLFDENGTEVFSHHPGN